MHALCSRHAIATQPVSFITAKLIYLIVFLYIIQMRFTDYIFLCINLVILNYKGKNERASVFFHTNLIIHACQKLKQSFIIWWVLKPLFVSLNTVFGSFAAIIVENLCRKLSLKYFPSGSSIAQLFSWRAHFSRVGWTNEHRAAWMGPTWQTRERNSQVTVKLRCECLTQLGLVFMQPAAFSSERGIERVSQGAWSVTCICSPVAGRDSTSHKSHKVFGSPWRYCHPEQPRNEKHVTAKN